MTEPALGAAGTVASASGNAGLGGGAVVAGSNESGTGLLAADDPNGLRRSHGGSEYRPISRQGDSDDKAESPQNPDIGDHRALKRIETRRTSDCTCCVLAIAFWAWVFMIGWSSLRDGDPRRLYHAFDYSGSLCGVDDDVKHMPLVYWPDPAKIHYPICVDACPEDDKRRAPMPVEHVSRKQRDNETLVTEIVATVEHVPTYPSVRVGGIFCLPKAHAEIANTLLNSAKRVGSPTSTLRAVFKDVVNAWAVLIFLIPVSVGMGYMYFYLLKHCAKILTWSVLAGLLALAIGSSVYLLTVVANDKHKAEAFFSSLPDDPVHAARVAGWIMCGVSGMVLICICFFLRSVQRAVGCIEASCDAMWDLPRMLLLPLVEVALKISFVLQWILVFAFVLTDGSIGAPTAEVDGTAVNGMVHRFGYTWSQKCRIVAYILALFWGIETLTMLFQFLMSHAVAVWYFTPCNDDFSKPGVDPAVWRRGLWFAFRYHLGSICLGAAVVGTLRPLNLVLSLVTSQARGHNAVAEAVAYACMYCTWCFEEVVRFINKNAVIELVLMSTDFFTAAGTAVRRLAQAAPEVASLNGITGVFQFLGVASITSAGTYLAYLLVSHVPIYNEPQSSHYVESRDMVIGVASMISLSISAAFMFVFDMTSDTLLFCWLTDTEDGTIEYAPPQLRNLLGPPDRSGSAALKDF